MFAKDKIYIDILDNERKKIFSQLSFLSQSGFYLAGGTALALQLGHRTSIDFDFYSHNKFDRGEILKSFKDNTAGIKIKVIRDSDDTFEAVLNKKFNVSFFCYDYPLIRKAILAQGIKIASKEDISAMKIVAIGQRGKRRDFVDIYYLLDIYSLGQILNFTESKFKEFDIYHGLRSLIYFEDADNDPDIDRIKVFDKKVTWKNIKKRILKEVKNFQTKS